MRRGGREPPDGRRHRLFRRPRRLRRRGRGVPETRRSSSTASRITSHAARRALVHLGHDRVPRAGRGRGRQQALVRRRQPRRRRDGSTKSLRLRGGVKALGASHGVPRGGDAPVDVVGGRARGRGRGLSRGARGHLRCFSARSRRRFAPQPPSPGRGSSRAAAAAADACAAAAAATSAACSAWADAALETRCAAFSLDVFATAAATASVAPLAELHISDEIASPGSSTSPAALSAANLRA